MRGFPGGSVIKKPSCQCRDIGLISRSGRSLEEGMANHSIILSGKCHGQRRLKVGEGDNRGWDGWMASLTQWTWVWVNSRSWWWTGRPGVLQSMGLQSQTQLSDWTDWLRTLVGYSPWGHKRVGYALVAEQQQQTEMHKFSDCEYQVKLLITVGF